MSWFHENDDKSPNSKEELETNILVGAAISACYIASIDEGPDQYMNRCQADDMAVSFHQISLAEEKDEKYTTLLNAIKDGFPNTLY